MKDRPLFLALFLGFVAFLPLRAEGPYYGAFRRLPLTAIQPTGWLNTYLQNQKEGLTGHLEEAGFPFDTVGWAGDIPRDFKFYPKEEPEYQAWWPYEQTAYWVDGLMRAGLLLKDDFLLKKARAQTQTVVNGGKIRLPRGAADFMWTQVVFFRALQADYEATGNPQILEALHQYFLTLKPADLQHTRAGIMVETILWAYGKTGDEKLLKLAVDGYKASNTPVKETGIDREVKEHNFRFELWEIEGFLLREHGVTYNEVAKLPTLFYLYTGKKSYLQMAHNSQAMLEKFHLLVDGVPSSQEALNGNQPNADHETCDVSDFLWSRAYLLLADGQVRDADAVERVAFNAAPAVVTKDFTSHQYHSSPNQVIATSATGARRDLYTYHGGHTPECCTGNVSRVMPNFIGHMWLADGKNGLAAMLYGPANVTWKVGAAQTPISIETQTEYPFRDRIAFLFKPQAPVEFPFSFRIPGWCQKAEARLNGKPLEQPLRSGTMVTVQRKFQAGDRLELIFPMEIRVSRWAQFGSWIGAATGVAIERGPLLYSEDIPEQITPFSDPSRATAKWPDNYPAIRNTKRLPAIDVTPGGPWNYALDIDLHDPRKGIEVVESAVPANPWVKETTPVRLKVPARQIPGWDMTRAKHPWSGKTHFMLPALPHDFNVAPEKETITLVPYGSTLLRLTVFPLVEDAVRSTQ